MRGVSLTLPLGLLVLAVLGLAGVRLKWPPPALWRGAFVVGTVMTAVYLVWILFRVSTLP